MENAVVPMYLRTKENTVLSGIVWDARIFLQHSSKGQH